MQKYKLTSEGQAYLAAAKDGNKPQKGIITTNVKGRPVKIDIQSITDDQAKMLHDSGSNYVEPTVASK